MTLETESNVRSIKRKTKIKTGRAIFHRDTKKGIEFKFGDNEIFLNKKEIKEVYEILTNWAK